MFQNVAKCLNICKSALSQTTKNLSHYKTLQASYAKPFVHLRTDTMFITQTAVTSLKEVTQIVSNLDFLETASLLHAVANSIRQGQSLGDTLEELNVEITGITDGGCGLLPSYRDISDERELIGLASFCTANLMQAYSWE